MMTTSRTPAVLSLAIVVAVTLVSCGGDSEGTDGSETSQDEICADVQTLSDAIDSVDSAEGEDDLMAAFDAAADAGDAMRATAPADLSDDVDLIAEGLRVFADADADAGGEAQEALDRLDPEALGAASDRFEEYAEESCDVDFAS